jgi:hypothetical protein
VKPYFHFKVIKAFMERIYKESIVQTNLINDGEELHFDELWQIDPVQNVAVEKTVPPEHRNCVLATKGNEKYIVPVQFLEHIPFKVTAWQDCYLKKSDKKVWKLVTGVHAILLPADKQVNVRDFTDAWNPIEHTNPQTWTFLKMVALSTRHMGSKLCICSTTATGKNAHLTLLSEMKRDVLITATPSIARYETALFYNRVINLNEMGKPKAEESDGIRDIIIWLGDQSVRYNKRSLAVKREMGSLDITKTSNIITYNRLNCLKTKELFFDNLWSNPSAIRNRYAQLLLEGKVTETVKDLSPFNVDQILASSDLDIKKVISGLVGLGEAVSVQQHNYTRHLLMMHSKEIKWGFTPRQITNIQGLIEYIDSYCKDQDEFDYWMLYLNNAKMSYDQMLLNERALDEADDDTGPKAKALDLNKLKAFEGDVI